MVNNSWKTVTLSQIGTFRKGSGISRAESNSGTLPAVRYGELYTVHNNYVRTYTSHISREVANQALRVHYGDVLFACSGETKEDIAKCAAIIDGSEVYAGGDIIVLSPTTEVDPIFLGFILNTQNVIQQRAQKAQGDAIVHISTDSIKSIEITLPGYEEQVRIAEALSDIDTLIVNLEKLIAKKKAIKQGAMQELLTGKRRLPGFDGEWKTETWGDVLSGFSSGATPYRGIPAYYKGNIKWVSSGELNYNVIHDTLEHISSEAADKTSLTMHPEGTFLMAITGLEAAGTRGSCALLGAPATTNQSCMAIYSTSKMTTSFLFHYYTLFGDELALKYCQGTKQQSYTAAIVKILPIIYPVDVDEQNAITAVLNDMNSEISALKEKLTKARFVKSGMMSELLTGHIRLIDKEDV